MKKPNILLIITDQQHADAMSCAGNPYVHTQAMDSIGANGVIFRNTYCTNPVCVPSRIAMFTGCMPHEAGVYSNTYKAPKLTKFPWLGKIMENAGYDCGYFGKWHLILPPRKKRIHGFKTLSLSKGSDRDQKATGPAIKFIKKSRSTNKPFFTVVSYINPHDICQFARRDPMKNSKIPPIPVSAEFPPLPANFPSPQGEPDMIRKIHSESWKRYPTADWTETDWREYLWAYYRLVELADQRTGEVLEALRETGQEEETVVIFLSDHGEGMAAHGWNQKQVFYETVSRVPLIISQKGTTRAGVIDEKHLASGGLDLIPTICDFAEIPLPEDFLGKSLRPYTLEDLPPNQDEFVISETEFGSFVPKAGNHHGRPNGRMVRTSRYKYSVFNQGNIREMLIDMEEDPEEMHNLSMTPNYREILEKHRSILQTWCIRTEDDFNYIISD